MNGILIVTLVFVVLLVFWAWMLWDLAHNQWIEPSAKYVWAAAFLFTFVIGAGAYYFMEYRPRR